MNYERKDFAEYYLNIFNWQTFNNYPEAVEAVWQRYVNDDNFKNKIDMLIADYVPFKVRFYKYFGPYLTNKAYKGR